MTLRDDFRGPLPLGDADFAEARRRVLSKIDRREKRPIPPWAFAFAAAAVAVLVILLMPHATPPNRPPIAVHRERPVIQEPPPVAPTVAPPIRVAHSKITHPPAHKKPEVLTASGGPPPSDSEISMNIQTADPNIRIIWIARR